MYGGRLQRLAVGFVTLALGGCAGDTEGASIAVADAGSEDARVRGDAKTVGDASATQNEGGAVPHKPDAGAQAVDAEIPLVDAGMRADTGAPDSGGVGGDASTGLTPTLASVSSEDLPCRDLDPTAHSLTFGGARLAVTNAMGVTVLRGEDFSVERTFARHTDWVRDASLSAKGDVAASVGDDNMLRFWRAASANELARVALRTDPAQVVFAAADDAVFVVDTEGGVSLRPFGTDAPARWTLSSLGKEVRVAPLPDGQRFAVASQTGVTLHSQQTGERLAQIHSGRASAVAVSSNDRIALASAGSVLLKQLSDPGPSRELRIPGASLSQVALSSDGQWLAASDQQDRVFVWRVVDRTMVHELRTVGSVRTLAFSPDGRHLAAADYWRWVWRVSDGKALVHPFLSPSGRIWRVAVAPSGRYVAFARAGDNAQVWDMARGALVRVFERRPGQNQGMVSFGSNDLLLVNTNDEANLWDLGQERPARIFRYASQGKQPDRNGPMHLSPDLTTLAGPGPSDAPGRIRFWNALDGSFVGALPGHEGGIGDMQWSSDGGQVISIGPERQDGTGVHGVRIKVWNVATLELLAEVETGHEHALVELDVSPDGTRIVTADFKGLVRLWSAPDLRLLRELATPPPVGAVAARRVGGHPSFSHDGRLVAVPASHPGFRPQRGEIALFRVRDGALVRQLWSPFNGTYGATFTPDGRYLAAGTYMGVRLWCLSDTPAMPVAPPL